MGVTVDETGQRRHATPVERFGRLAMSRGDVGIGPDGDDSIARDRDGGVLQNTTPGVQSDGGDMADQNVGHCGLSMRA